MFVAIDGLDGSGKSTVARALAADLESDGMRISVREHPGEGRWGRMARRSLLGHGRAAKTSSAVFLFLDILSTGWRVRMGDHVIAVRYTLSAYYLEGKTDLEKMNYRDADFYQRMGCKVIYGKKAVQIHGSAGYLVSAVFVYRHTFSGNRCFIYNA